MKQNYKYLQNGKLIHYSLTCINNIYAHEEYTHINYIYAS